MLEAHRIYFGLKHRRALGRPGNEHLLACWLFFEAAHLPTWKLPTRNHSFNDRVSVDGAYPEPWEDSQNGSTQQGSIMYTVGVLESRIGGSIFWILPGPWLDKAFVNCATFSLATSKTGNSTLIARSSTPRAF